MSERSIINTLLVVCVALGFICVATIYLPAKLGNAGEGFSARPLPNASRLLALLPATDAGQGAEPSPSNLPQGTFMRFTPEPEPPSPFMTAQADPATKGYERPETPSSPLARAHRESSLAVYDPGKPKEAKGRSPFSVLPEIEADVSFWRDIYARYDSHQVVLHDMKYLTIVYGVLDFTNLDSDTSLTDIERQRQKQATIDAEREKFISILERLSMNPAADQLSDAEMAVKKMFRDVSDPDRFRRAKERGVRAQTGQKDKFIAGLAYSGRYLGEIESIFERQGLPRELTFLIFVESMFNPAANSSAGARGIWQFMRGTAKIYGLRMNSIVDERADPIRATYAAANMLRNDYEHLGSWPLAVNAYNTGRGRMNQAVARMGTTNIGTIVKYFEHPAYGFASRNFYLEFLAAMDVAKNCHRYFGAIRFDPPLKYDLVQTAYPVRLSEVAAGTAIPIETIAEMNPAYTPAVTAGKLPLPVGSELRVPEKKGEHFLAYCARVPQTYPFWHVVEDGETVQEIAAMYNLPVASILRANKLAGKRLHPGQEIRIQK